MLKCKFEDKSFDEALKDIEEGNVGKIPNHIKTDSQDYKYPHNYKRAYVVQQYLPDKIKNKKYYKAKNNKYEQSLNKLHNEMIGEKI